MDRNPEFKYTKVYDDLYKVNHGHWVEWEEEGCHTVRTCSEYSDGLYGIEDGMGKEIIPAIQDEIEYDAVKCLFNVRNKYGRGVYNRNGKLIVKGVGGEYEEAKSLYDWQTDYNTEGYSVVYYKGFVGRMNASHEQVAFLSVTKESQKEIVIPNDIDWACDSCFPVTVFYQSDKCGVLTQGLEKVVPAIFDKILIFEYNGVFAYVCVCNDDSNKLYRTSSCALYSQNGDELLPCIYSGIEYIGHGLFAIRSTEGIKVVDFNGKRTTSETFNSVQGFVDESWYGYRSGYSLLEHTKIAKRDMCIVTQGSLKGAMNSLGALIVPLEYEKLSIADDCLSYAEHSFLNFSGSKLFKTNEIASTPLKGYDILSITECGYYIFERDGLCGCVNQIGSEIIPPKYDSLMYQNGVFVFSVGNNATKSFETGVLDRRGNELIPASSNYEAIEILQYFIKVKTRGGYYLLFTLDGRQISNNTYQHVENFTENLIKVGGDVVDYEEQSFCYFDEDGDCCDYTDSVPYHTIDWGLLSFDGDLVLPIKYRNIVLRLSEGLIVLKEDNNYGFSDVDGRLILPPKYESVHKFCDGFAIVGKRYYGYYTNGRGGENCVYYGVIDYSFNEVLPCVYESIEYKKSLSLFYTNKGWKNTKGQSLVECNGEWVVFDPKYMYCKDCKEGILTSVICLHESTPFSFKYGLISLKGVEITPPEFNLLRWVADGLYVYNYRRYMKECYYTGDLIPCEEHDPEAIINYECGFIDSQGHKLADVYSSIGLFYNGLCAVAIGGVRNRNNILIDAMWGFVDEHARPVIPCIYDGAFHFEKGLSPVKSHGHWGMINEKGDLIIPFVYDSVMKELDSNGLWRLYKDRQIFTFDVNGEVIDVSEEDDDDDY